MKLYFLVPFLLQKFIWIPTRLLLNIFGSLHIEGLINLNNSKKPTIFACNHSNEIDPILIPAAIPFWSKFSPVFYVIREKSFYKSNGWVRHLFGGVFIKSWGGYTANVGLHDYQKSLKDHIKIFKEGAIFCIFPEGGITYDGNIQSARGGVAYLASTTNSNVIPVNIDAVYGMSFADFFMRRRKIKISFGNPITTEDLDKLFPIVESGSISNGINIYKDRAEYIMKKIAELKR